MKPAAILALILALSASTLAMAQPAGMGGMDMKDKGMDMRDKGMNMKPNGNTPKAIVHQATGVVDSVDPANDKATLAHEAVKSLQWPAMTMSFTVKDKMMFDSLLVGKKVSFEFIQQGSDYVMTAVK